MQGGVWMGERESVSVCSDIALLQSEKEGMYYEPENGMVVCSEKVAEEDEQGVGLAAQGRRTS